MSVVASEERAAVLLNDTFVRPKYFYLSGLLHLPYVKYFGAFLCFVYIVTVLANVFLLSVIYQVKSLHTPKYMIVCNLALTDLCESTTFIPRVLETLLNSRYILYEDCLSSLFFIRLFSIMQSWSLVTMAYDRLIAICFPLRYHRLVTKQSIAAILLFSWVCTLGIVAFVIKSLDRLSFCGSVVIPNVFCQYVAIFYLACNDTSFTTVVLYFTSIVLMCVPLIFILVTYICIGIALIRIASAQERRKAMKTCTAHLILVTIFYLPITLATIATIATYIHPSLRMIDYFFTLTVPALLNPIMYSFKTDEVLQSIKKLYGGEKFKLAVAK